MNLALRLAGITLLTIVFLLQIFQACTPASNSKPSNEALIENLQELINNFEGEVGLYVRHLESGFEIDIQADEVFPSASLVKVPILFKIFQEIDVGNLAYDESYTYSDSLDLYPYPDDEGITGNLKEGASISLGKLANLMIYFSDNDASLWCQALAGGGEAINALMEDLGYDLTRVNSRTPGREEDQKALGWGQTSPREMSNMLVQLRENAFINPGISQKMYRILTRVYWDGEAIAGIPPYVQVASKQGAVSASRSEVLLVNAPSGDYVFCLITKNQQDKSWDHDNAGFELLREVSNSLWNHFEPDHPFERDPDGETYW